MPHDRNSSITLCVSDATQSNRQKARREKAGLVPSCLVAALIARMMLAKSVTQSAP
jgi:hypothetical protein